MKRIACLAILCAALAVPCPAAAADTPDVRYPSEEALRHYLSGRWLEESGDLAGAGGEFARALAIAPDDDDLLLHASELASKAGDPGRSLELARRLLARDPARARARWLEGAALFNLQRADEAVPALRAAVAADSANADYLRTLARVAEALERVELMDSCYTRLVIADPDDPENWFQLASVRARQGRFGEADTALNRSLEGNPIRPGALFLSGWIRERLGRTGEAIGLYAHHLEAHPQDDATRRRLVTLLADAGRFSEALVHARLITAASPKDGVARQVEADLEFRAGHPEAGEQALARMRELSPDDPEGVARSVQVLARYHRVARALKLADDWSDARPTDARGLELRAWARSQANQPDSAVSWARRLVDTQPDSIGPRRLLARYLREAHRYSDAIDQIGELRRRQPGDAGLLLDLGFCREQLGDVPGAIEAGRDALGLAPDAAPALNFLGYLLADHERDLPEAEKLIRRAVEQDPDNGAYVDSMGWLLFRLGQYDRAREQLERAVALTGGDPVIHEHLGDVYAQLKMFDRARREYQLSLAGDSPNPRVKGKLDSVR